MNTERYAVFLDLDSTLMCSSVVPQVNIDTIAQVRERGHYVILNTARSYAYIPEHIRNCDFLDGFVAGIGTDLRLHGKQILSHALHSSEVKRIAQHFLNDTREICFEGEADVLWLNPQRPSALRGVIVTQPEDFDIRFLHCRISKVYIGGALSPEEAADFEKDYLVIRHANYSEFVKKGFGKAQGMAQMMALLGLPMKNSIAMGDSANDADMLQAAGVSVAMGNAIDEIKCICTFVSCNAKDGGVAMALKKLILEK